MDAGLSLVMANLAQVKKDDLVIDPFVGSGKGQNYFTSTKSSHEYNVKVINWGSNHTAVWHH